MQTVLWNAFLVSLIMCFTLLSFLSLADLGKPYHGLSGPENQQIYFLSDLVGGVAGGGDVDGFVFNLNLFPAEEDERLSRSSMSGLQQRESS